MRGTYVGKFMSREYEIEYTAIVEAEYSFQKGRMYMPNGDPGYPDEEEWGDVELKDIDEIHVWREDEEVTDEFDWEMLQASCINHFKSVDVDDVSWEKEV